MIYKNREVCKDTYYVGASDRRLALFENIYPLTNGASYNSYLILDEKTCVLDGVDHLVRDIYVDKVKAGLNGRKLDYLIVQHMEPDHACCLKDLIALYPDLTVVLNAKSRYGCVEIVQNIVSQAIPCHAVSCCSRSSDIVCLFR